MGVVSRGLKFWFDEVSLALKVNKNNKWLVPGPDFDHSIENEFGADFEATAIGDFVR